MEPFLWGVATAAYQVEGGLNSPGGPENNWADWERIAKVERSGEALRFWSAPDELLDRAAWLGCNAFRMSLEWARIEPADDKWDAAVVTGYADIIAAARERGLEPVVTLHHFTHPAWCGADFWLEPGAPRRFATFVRRVVDELGRLVQDRGRAPVRWWVSVNEPGVVALAAHLAGVFPSLRRGLDAARRSYDNLVAAHILAYDAVHDVYEERAWADPLVSTNTVTLTAVELDSVLIAILRSRELGTGAFELGPYVRNVRERSRTRLAAVRRGGPVQAALDRAANVGARSLSLRADGAALRELQTSKRPRKLDYIALTGNEPAAGRYVRVPLQRGASLRRGFGIADPWELAPSPDALAVCLRHAHLLAPDLPILIAENGLCTRDRRVRRDGLSRDVFLRSMCREVVRARAEGLPVAGYLYRTLADGYEWGSYTPRQGLFGVDRVNELRVLETDATGADAARSYREVIAADRAE